MAVLAFSKPAISKAETIVYCAVHCNTAILFLSSLCKNLLELFSMHFAEAVILSKICEGSPKTSCHNPPVMVLSACIKFLPYSSCMEEESMYQ